MATQRASLYIALTRAGLTVAVAFGLTRVFDEGRWPLAVVIAAVLPHMIISFADRRRWRALTQLLALTVAAFAYSMFVVEAHTLRGAIPTGDTIDIYRTDLGNAFEELRTAIVPVSPTGSALLLAILALFVAGAVAEWSARRLDVTTGAIAPSLVLFVALAALGDGSWAIVTAIYTLAIAAYLMALQLAELTDRRSWFHATTTRRSRLAAGGTVTAVAVVFAAAIIGPQAPGAQSEPWFDYRALGDDEGTLVRVTTPIIGIYDKLKLDADRVVMYVEADRPVFWRLTALDVYEKDERGNEIWTLQDERKGASEIPRAPERYVRTSPPLRQVFEIVDSDPYWLPAAYRAEVLSGADAEVIKESVSLFRNSEERINNLRYEVTSRVPTPTAEERAAAPPIDPDDFERYTKLPDDMPDSIREEAERITAGAQTPHEQVEALLAYFNDNPEFTYSLDVRGEDLETLEQFLFETKTGYCEQYATAFGVLARSLGLPTRVAVGYTPGTLQPDGRYRVTNGNAHAWNEVYFEGYGWLPFDPTPGDGFREPTLEGGGTSGQVDTSSTTPPTTASTPGSTGTPPSSVAFPPRPTEVETTGADPSAGGPSTPRRILESTLLFGGTVLAVVIAIIGVLALLASRRTWRRRHATDPRDRVLGAWRQALEHLAEAGVDPRPWATANEFALRYAPAQGAGDAGAPLVHLAHLQTAALFSPRPPSDEDADSAWGYTHEIDQALAKRVPWHKRLRRRLDPRR